MNRGLLDRYYKGECSQEEVKAVLAWFQANKLDAEKEQELQALWQSAGQVEEHAHDAGRIFSKIKEQLQEPQQPEQQETSNIIRFPQLHQQQFWLKVAAAVLLPLCLTWGLVRYTTRSKATAAVYMSVVAEPGVKKTINLPDGSIVRLNAGSKVSFLRNFDADKREIQLRGEAFFEVAKDSLRPFIVHTGSISTQALGTSFNINYSLFDDAITVALATGVVKVDKQEQGKKRKLTKLVPGQQLSYSKASKQYAVAEFNRNEVLGWTEGVLTFKQADMDQTVRKLENWYGVDIEVDARGMQNEAWNYTGEYDNETLEKVLEGIGFVKGFTYERNENKVRIVFN
jgi:ferric-dicitrate binding protein FerR (iron transport regulator)